VANIGNRRLKVLPRDIRHDAEFDDNTAELGKVVLKSGRDRQAGRNRIDKGVIRKKQTAVKLIDLLILMQIGRHCVFTPDAQTVEILNLLCVTEFLPGAERQGNVVKKKLARHQRRNQTPVIEAIPQCRAPLVVTQLGVEAVSIIFGQAFHEKRSVKAQQGVPLKVIPLLKPQGRPGLEAKGVALAVYTSHASTECERYC